MTTFAEVMPRINGSEPTADLSPARVLLHALSMNVTEALMNGEAYDPLRLNSEGSSSGNEQTDANDTEDDAVETNAVDESFFDTASDGTNPTAY